MCNNNDGARFPLKTKDSSVCFHITTNRINMDDSDHRNRHEKAAKMLLLADDGKLKVSEAMRLAGLSHEDSMNRTAQMQVRRMAEKLKNQKKKRPINSAQALQSATPLNRPPFTTVSVACVKRKLTNMATKMRLNSKHAHAGRKESAETRAHYTQSFKNATLLCAEEEKKPKKQRKSAETIVREINEKENVILCSRTVRNYVNQGKVGETPEKRGEKGSIISQA